MTGAVHADGADRSPELRVSAAYLDSSDAYMVAAAWFRRAPAWLRAARLEYSVGAIDDGHSSRAIGFVGPVWVFSERARNRFVEISTGPALLSGSTIGGRELGGNFQFRSALAIGTSFGTFRPLRVEHISNAGLREPNPGFDVVGLSVSFNPR